MGRDSMDYYSQHGIWGAYSSLVLGRIGRGAGLVVGGVRPPETGLFVGYREAGAKPRVLPFSSGRRFGLGAAAYKADSDLRDDAAAFSALASAIPFSYAEMERRASLSGEEWRAGLLRMEVLSSFGPKPDPEDLSREEARKAFMPALLVRLEFDNSAGDAPMAGFFGMQGVNRLLSESTDGRLLGLASGRLFGFAVEKLAEAEEIMDWSALRRAFGDGKGSEAGAEFGRGPQPRRLASEGGIRFWIPSRSRREYVLALGVYRDGAISSGIEASAYYTSLFENLEDVLRSALEGKEASIAEARAFDAAERAEAPSGAPLSADRLFMLSHAVHSYAANTELLSDSEGKPIFVVYEGEYRMMNTLDLSVDQAFWEARYSPWTLKNILESSMRRSAYSDSLGLVFCHDQGVAGCFSPPGRSSYELADQDGCFSYMGYEETLNWCILFCFYANCAADWAWARRRAPVLASCLASLRARDRDGDGIMDADSDRCGSGSETSTYDSLDHSLGRARGSLYLGVKTWAAYVCMEALFTRLGAESRADSCADFGADWWERQAEAARVGAGLAAETIASGAREPDGRLPALLDGTSEALILPALEGLVYPRFCGAGRFLSRTGSYAKLILALERHALAALKPGVCIDAESGGWKLSSTSPNTWLSKIFLNQYAAREVLGIEDDWEKRDSVHASWLKTGCADFAATDQVDSRTGRDLGSRLYPRLVSSALWLE